MGGNTGNLRTLRSQSGTNGQRTLGSILASDSGNGAGSIARLAKWYAVRGPNNGIPSFFTNELNIKRGSLSMYNNLSNYNYYSPQTPNNIPTSSNTISTSSNTITTSSNKITADENSGFSRYPINRYLNY